MISRLAHVCIRTADLAAAENFYVQKLGMEKAFDFFRAGQRIGFYLIVGDRTFIEIFVDSGEQASARQLINHFCLEVENLESVKATLSERGVSISEKNLGADNSWQAWITDPSGVRIELMQYSHESSQFTGDTVVLD